MKSTLRTMILLLNPGFVFELSALGMLVEAELFLSTRPDAPRKLHFRLGYVGFRHAKSRLFSLALENAPVAPPPPKPGPKPLTDEEVQAAMQGFDAREKAKGSWEAWTDEDYAQERAAARGVETSPGTTPAWREHVHSVFVKDQPIRVMRGIYAGERGRVVHVRETKFGRPMLMVRFLSCGDRATFLVLPEHVQPIKDEEPRGNPRGPSGLPN
jgi:hypothetical protein